MPIHPGQVEPLAERTRDLYAAAEERLFGIIARQLEQGLEAPGWAQRKLAAIQQLRRASQAVVDELGKAVTLDVFDAVAEAYNTGHRAAVAELGALSDDARRLADEVTPNAQSVDRLAQEAVDKLTETHRSILRAVDDRYRAVVAQVSADPLLGTATRRQAAQRAVGAWAEDGITSFRDKAGRRWQLTSYAEMAVRTSVGRAATEAHTRTLDDAGVDLVIVSNSPRECPLCRPYERRVLSVGGPDGRHTVQVEHATEDGRMVSVDVLDSLDGARRHGFQHPNCRHSVSAYLPGLTPTDNATPDPDGYKAGQRQREIERHIRRWKRDQASALTPEAKRKAQRKVRQWQGEMRKHLDAHPDLRRLRAREQPGASNLPKTTRAPSADAQAAARVRSGDTHTPAELTDEQLNAAVRSGVLDEKHLAKVADETDRRELADLVDRATDRGALVDDLTGFSDEQLGTLMRALGTDDATLRVAAELDRRDLTGRMPDARPDLVGLSDAQLAEKARRANGDELSSIAEEADRRDRLARLFPGGNLADDLTTLGEDELGWAVRYAEPAEVERIAAEIDRRDPPPPLPEASTATDGATAFLDDVAALDAHTDPMPDLGDWGALADDATFAEEAARLAAPTAAEETAAAGTEAQQRFTRAQAREMYTEYVYRQWLDAEDDCRGELLNRKAEAKGVDPMTLFSGPAHVAFAHASEELVRWWLEHGRLTQVEFIAKATGTPSREATKAAEAFHAAHLRWKGGSK